jgi:hypothetical protein
LPPATRRSAVRTLIGLTVLIHPMRIQDGPLAGRGDRRVREALIDVCQRMLAG